MKVTVVMPCYGRPKRTIRAIESLIAQDMEGWEAIIRGDDCPVFQELIDNGYLEKAKAYCEKKGNILDYAQHKPRSGAHGFEIINKAIEDAKGEYFTFFANDDVLEVNHLGNYYRGVQGYDYAYYNSWVDPIDQKRVPSLSPCLIGHSEIIVKTELARKCGKHKNVYGHDWDFINEIIQLGKGIYIDGEPTYKIMHVPAYGTKDKIN